MAELFVRLIPTFFAPPFRLMTQLIGGGGGAALEQFIVYNTDEFIVYSDDKFIVYG